VDQRFYQYLPYTPILIKLCMEATLEDSPPYRVGCDVPRCDGTAFHSLIEVVFTPFRPLFVGW
jgi:hypothetical protein